MKNFAKRIAALRKERHLTQAEMAKDLALSRQTVSNWEQGAIEPNMGIVSKIATYFDVSTDYLLGHETYTTQYEEKYKQEGFYWGDKVNDLAHEVLKLMPPTRPVRLLDIGCGEGQAAVFFSRVGYHVSAFDIAESGLAKGRRLAATAGVRVNFFQADLLRYRIADTFDIIYSTDVLEYVPPNDRERIIKNIQERTAPGGLNVLDTFVDKPFIEIAPDWEHGKEYFWRTGELFSYYNDWQIELLKEPIFDCDSADVPHKHCMDMLIARKMGGGNGETRR